MDNRIAKLSADYFEFLAQKFPVMCASDEFHFLPRVQSAASFYDRLDNLDRQGLQETLAVIRDYQNQFRKLESAAVSLERVIDIKLLIASAAGILIEMDMKKAWRHNPLLYLKVSFIGLDHALGKPFSSAAERDHRVLSRLSKLPGLLIQARENLTAIPLSYHTAAISMISDCREYLKWFANQKDFEKNKNLFEETFIALDQFKGWLSSEKPVPDSETKGGSLEATLRDHFLCKKSLPEIFELAHEDWHDNLSRLDHYQNQIDDSSAWLDLYHGYLPDQAGDDTIALYRGEFARLKTFFKSLGFNAQNMEAPLEIAETPRYLRSVRASASFGAAFSSDKNEKSYFYITAQKAGYQSSETERLLKQRLHREYCFLTAHETIPGHHLLDATRRRLPNPVRRQIESPLYYEGWSYYGETLLAENGYLNHPIENLVDHKRRLWRAARCMIDAGLPSGLISRVESGNLLARAGFSPEESGRQMDRFNLNPGYQLCYSLGRHEFQTLKMRFENKMGSMRFHDFILSGGQLPFDLLVKRFEAELQKETP